MTRQVCLALRSKETGLYVEHFSWDFMWEDHEVGSFTVTKPRHGSEWVKYTNRVADALTFQSLTLLLKWCYCYSPQSIRDYFKPAVSPLNLEIVKVTLTVESTND